MIKTEFELPPMYLKAKGIMTLNQHSQDISVEDTATV